MTIKQKFKITKSCFYSLIYEKLNLLEYHNTISVLDTQSAYLTDRGSNRQFLLSFLSLYLVLVEKHSAVVVSAGESI